MKSVMRIEVGVVFSYKFIQLNIEIMPTKNPPKIANRIISIMIAGIEAIAHLTIKTTIDPKGISKSDTFTVLDLVFV